MQEGRRVVLIRGRMGTGLTQRYYVERVKSSQAYYIEHINPTTTCHYMYCILSDTCTVTTQKYCEGITWYG